jgi:hypothetical protein
VKLKGSRELKARLRAISQSFKPIGKKWADDTAKLARARVPQRTGRLRQSIRRKNASQKRATVVAHYTAYFVDKGPRPHTIKARRGRKGLLIFEGRSDTIFAPKVRHRGYRGRPFRHRAAMEALERNPMAEEVIKAWNAAAR